MKELESHHQRIVTAKEVKGDAIFHNGKVFTFHETGLTRRVYVNAERTKVLKVPVSLIDYEHNRHEAEAWEQMNSEKREEFAECKLLENGWLEMEFLVTLNELSKDEKLAEEWSHIDLSAAQMAFAASCRNEVGFDKDGKLKCYDYDEYRRY